MPFLAFKRGGKYSRLVQRFFGDARIEDLWLPVLLHVVESQPRGSEDSYDRPARRRSACDHASARRLSAGGHRRRAARRWRPDQQRAGRRHEDVLEPGHRHRRRRVSATRTQAGVDYGDDVSGWQAIWNRFSPTRDKRRFRPSILLVVMRLIEFGGISYRSAERQPCRRLCVAGPPAVQAERFRAAREIRDVGYAAARASLDAWVARRSMQG